MSKNATKTNDTINFTAIESKVANMVIGTSLTYTKYNDNKNGYIGIKCGGKNVFSMYHLKNENSIDGTTKNTDGFTIGTTNEIFKYLHEKYSANNDITFVENGNSGDKTRNNNVVTKSIKLVYDLYKSVVDYYKPQTVTETK